MTEHPARRHIAFHSYQSNDALEISIQIPHENGFMVRNAIAEFADLLEVSVNGLPVMTYRLGSIEVRKHSQ